MPRIRTDGAGSGGAGPGDSLSLRFYAMGAYEVYPPPIGPGPERFDGCWINNTGVQQTITGVSIEQRKTGDTVLNVGSTVVDVRVNGVSIFGVNPLPTLTTPGVDGQSDTKLVFATPIVPVGAKVETILVSNQTGGRRDLTAIVTMT